MTAEHRPDSAPGHFDTADSPHQRPPTAWRLFRLLLLMLLVIALGFYLGHGFGGRILGTAREMWHDISGTKAATGQTTTKSTFYTCGMHPWVILPKPGPCPICHMPLVPLDPSKFTGQIAIDPVLAQNIGVRTADVQSGPLVRTVRTVGKLDYDEELLHDVNLKVAGWIEQLHVDYLGAPVQQGQPLFELYSPELYSAQKEYLLALQHESLPNVPFVPRVKEDAGEDLQAARTRLQYFGIDEAQIAVLERSRQPSKTMTIKSPFTGTVIKKMAVAGMRVDPGMQMYRIADLRKVWVTVTVYEYQLPFVELGQDATMSLSYVPGQTFHGHVTYVYPWTDEKTREVNVRLEFDNQNGLLKPGMFANVELHRTLAQDRTLVSRSAVLDTGERQVAFVSLGNGRFEPRDLRLGVEGDGDKVEVLDGLKPGEIVVVSAQFLLDSESKIREALLRMVRGNLVGAAQDKAETGPEISSLPATLSNALGDVLANYLRIGDGLAHDSIDDVAEPARGIAAGVDAMLAVAIPGHEHFWHQHDEAATIRGKALELVAAKDIAAARLSFTDLSVALGKLLRATGVPAAAGKEVEELHCPMFLENQGGSVWLQADGKVRNPYFGTKMSECFDRRTPLPEAVEKTAAATPADADVDALVDAYLQAAATLADDRTDDLAASWQQLKASAGSLTTSAPAPIADLARKVEAAVPSPVLDLGAVRKAFAKLSAAVTDLLRAAPAGQPLERAFCPMAKASWLQRGKQLHNPYQGKAMPDCGSIEEGLPARTSKGGKR